MNKYKASRLKGYSPLNPKPVNLYDCASRNSDCEELSRALASGPAEACVPARNSTRHRETESDPKAPFTERVPSKGFLYRYFKAYVYELDRYMKP